MKRVLRAAAPADRARSSSISSRRFSSLVTFSDEDSSSRRIEFDKPLVGARVVGRRRRFTFECVDDAGNEFLAHCPATSSIANVDFKAPDLLIPCLMAPTQSSEAVNEFTVDALHFKDVGWVGINQIKVNRWVKEFARRKALTGLADDGVVYSGETKLKTHNVIDRPPRYVPSNAMLEFFKKHRRRMDESRIDFRVAYKHYVEIKTPLNVLKPSCVPLSHHSSIKDGSFPGMERLVFHLVDLARFLEKSKGHKASMVMAFLYKNPPVWKKPESVESKIYEEAFGAAIDAGMAYYQINMTLDPRGVEVDDFFELS